MNITLQLVARALPVRRPSSRKGENGVVVVLGGSKDFAGAPALAGLGALRAGADLAFLIVPEFAYSAVASFSPDFIVRAYPGDCLNSQAHRAFREVSGKAGALCVGNGLSRARGVMVTASALASSFRGPVVVDGDALGFVFPENAVFTPHAGEFERLTGRAPPSPLKERGEAVRKAAAKLGSVILLKGAVDVVSDGERVALNSTGNASMTVGGTGDVLAGVLAAFLSRGVPAFEAACSAAFVNGAAGDLAFREYGNGLLASDLPACVARVLRGMGR